MEVPIFCFHAWREQPPKHHIDWATFLSDLQFALGLARFITPNSGDSPSIIIPPTSSKISSDRWNWKQFTKNLFQFLSKENRKFHPSTAKISHLDTSRNLQVQGFHRRPCQTTGEITSPSGVDGWGKGPSRCWLLKPGSYSTHRKFCSLLKASHHRHLNKNIEIYIPTCNSFSTHQKPFINQKQNMVLVSMAFLRVACFLFQNLLSGMIFKRAPALMTAS